MNRAWQTAFVRRGGHLPVAVRDMLSDANNSHSARLAVSEGRDPRQPCGWPINSHLLSAFRERDMFLLPLPPPSLFCCFKAGAAKEKENVHVASAWEKASETGTRAHRSKEYSGNLIYIYIYMYIYMYIYTHLQEHEVKKQHLELKLKYDNKTLHFSLSVICTPKFGNNVKQDIFLKKI